MTLASKLMALLPSVYLSADEATGFLERLLLVWETLLIGNTGVADAPAALGELLEQAWGYLELTQTPEEFLDWLAAQIGLTLESDWDLDRKQDIIAAALSLYRKRGTMEGVREYLRIYIGGIPGAEIKITECFGFQVGVRSTVGQDTVLGGRYFFMVNIVWPQPLSPGMARRKHQALQTIIDREKPVHTTYWLRITCPASGSSDASPSGGDSPLTEIDRAKEEGNNGNTPVALF